MKKFSKCVFVMSSKYLSQKIRRYMCVMIACNIYRTLRFPRPSVANKLRACVDVELQ
jgi:hypothetical protein